jgi:3-hydroxyacyl-CoA dehydrogenase
MEMSIDMVLVFGCGLMGSGIAQVCAQAGMNIVWMEPRRLNN